MEGRHCFAHLTIEENLLTGAFTRRDGKAAIQRDLDLVYSYFPRLKERRGAIAGYTSGGEQQMCAVGRALMSRPKMILLDEPSMGLAPQIVEEIFEIVKNLNEKEGVSFLLAEQNTNMALKYARYGYILENGRVVMDGAGQGAARERGRQGVLSRHRRGQAQVVPRREALQAAQALAGVTLRVPDAVQRERAPLIRDPSEAGSGRSAPLGTCAGTRRDADARPLRRPRNPRSRRARARAVRAPAGGRRARDDRAGLGEAARRRRSEVGRPRARRWRSCRCCASPTCWRGRRRARRSAASTPRRPARRSGCMMSPGPIFEPEGARQRTGGGCGARAVRRRLPAGRHRAQLASPIISRPAASSWNPARTRSAAP